MIKEILILVLALVFCWVQSSPVNLGSLEYDNLDKDISDLKYESDFAKLDDQSAEKKSAKANTSGFQKKNVKNKGAKVQYSIEDLKKFFKALGLTDDGSFDDSEVYGSAEGIAANAVGIKGNENRKYRKGTKTKGFHRVQHKDEYNKDKEFYEDDEISGEIKKVGAKGFGYGVKGGLDFDKGSFHHVRNKGIFGKTGFLGKGKTEKDFVGYDDEQGIDTNFDSEK
ncbi:unnamed protein product [Leptidea sinapis]|uniref:Uncharacterized protein n=1 Tax=Leptidea sinapis TaxID=189913 RepID=A0A5E4QHC0_9NEOP|nr:unnamed protein product [Leptidea sinapis]